MGPNLFPTTLPFKTLLKSNTLHPLRGPNPQRFCIQQVLERDLLICVSSKFPGVAAAGVAPQLGISGVGDQVSITRGVGATLLTPTRLLLLLLTAAVY